MSAPASSWFRPTPTGLVLHLRVTPNAGRDAIDGAEIRDDGSCVLRVRVSAVPDKGKANAAVIVLMAKALGTAKSTISLVSGDTSRQKTLVVSGDATVLAERAMAVAGG
ncbi:DUF167 family protein [Devosia sp. 63-57]|uniref:DUF167 family protein n=1 Tax=Devosia sp. 63-57 TaxID=1895751 RepID=UPI00086E2FE8|nr:DUF167 family protein [Devosia sp. 63-57]ODT51271.1 MAG: hypothetical protein ABS74_00925 [Pelagibacterium sp. SCN 63-126]ODU80879.1 MAG: hypothetical protein ABT14_18565 [Pelagibacterium sp. SCN 63-17]OJX41735.1 MAG: hypothetical protein BGO80_09060 [Devosia sp. 63-57]